MSEREEKFMFMFMFMNPSKKKYKTSLLFWLFIEERSVGLYIERERKKNI